MKCKEFTAWLEIDGQPVPEYAFMRIGSSVECYIPSMPGKVSFAHLVTGAMLMRQFRILLSTGLAIMITSSHLDTLSSMVNRFLAGFCKERQLPIAQARGQARFRRDHSPLWQRKRKVKNASARH